MSNSSGLLDKTKLFLLALLPAYLLSFWTKYLLEMPWHLCLGVFCSYSFMRQKKISLFLCHVNQTKFSGQIKIGLHLRAWVLTWSSWKAPPRGYPPHRKPRVGRLVSASAGTEKGLDEDPVVDRTDGEATRQGGAVNKRRGCGVCRDWCWEGWRRAGNGCEVKMEVAPGKGWELQGWVITPISVDCLR